MLLWYCCSTWRSTCVTKNTVKTIRCAISVSIKWLRSLLYKGLTF